MKVLVMAQVTPVHALTTNHFAEMLAAKRKRDATADKEEPPMSDDSNWELMKKSESFSARSAMMQERRQSQTQAQQPQQKAPGPVQATPPKND